MRVQRHKEANDDGVLLTDWRYRGLLLSFDSNGALYTANITSPAYRTARGVKVGDSVSVVRRRYGAPLHGDSYAYLYAISTDDSETLGISFFLESGRIKRIITGEVISVE